MPTPAKNLSDVYNTLDPRPLTKPDEFKAFYREGLDKVRGGQVVEKFQRRLEKAHNALPFKAFLMGHPGNGKSTELSRLTFAVEDRYVVYRFSVRWGIYFTQVAPSCSR